MTEAVTCYEYMLHLFFKHQEKKGRKKRKGLAFFPSLRQLVDIVQQRLKLLVQSRIVQGKYSVKLLAEKMSCQSYSIRHF